MNTINKITIAMGVSVLMLGCPGGDDATTGQDTDATTTPMTMTTMMMTTMTTDPMTSADTTEGMTADTTEGMDATATDTGTATDESTSTGIEPGPFVPDDPNPDLYTRVDRKGMPAVSTALILMPNKDAYNNANPSNDVMDAFLTDIAMSIGGFYQALNDDVQTLNLTPCASPTACRQQAEPYVIPDTLKIDTEDPTVFPNGRRLDDPAIDITLAVLLLDIMQESVMTFAEAPIGPVNPAENDVAFDAEFPFLAPAH